MIAVLIIVSGFLINGFLRPLPRTLALSNTGLFQQYVNASTPTITGSFNTSVLGSHAEFAYIVELLNTTNGIYNGPAVQIEFFELSCTLGAYSQGFAISINTIYVDLGEQYFNTSGLEFHWPGKSVTINSNTGFSPGSRIQFFDYEFDGGYNQIRSTFILTFVIVPHEIGRPFSMDGQSVIVNKTLAVNQTPILL